MELASSARIPDGLLAAMRLGSEKPHQGVLSRNPALYQGPTVCNSTTALGLRGQAELNRVGSCSTGKERDTESGNDYFDARYYSSAMGRFMSPDWSSVPVPIPFADITNPQSLNLYAYVGNNPLTRFDSDGHVVVDKGITYVYYPVTGATANEAIANSNTHFDGQFSGMTTPRFDVNFKPTMSMTDSGDNTRVTLTAPSDDKVTTTLSQTIQLPQWKSSDPAEQAAFDKSTAQLKTHEETHAADNRTVAETLDKSIPGTSASATSKNPQNAVNAASTKLNTKLGDKVNAAVADAKQKAKVLDDKTDHGRNP
jgi:RHS repeat-associated protein